MEESLIMRFVFWNNVAKAIHWIRCVLADFTDFLIEQDDWLEKIDNAAQARALE